MIRASGVGSGIDIESIVTSLMAIERQPRDAVQAKLDSLDVQLSAFGKARSAISNLAESIKGFTESKQFGGLIATSSDESIFTATAANSADVEFHNIEVLSLAQAHQAATTPYASETSEAGTGKWSFASGGNSFDITIDNSNNSLTALRDAINDSSENSSVNASILNVGNGSRLILTARETGLDNVITATREVPNGGLFGGTTTTSPFTTSRDASDASFTIDGFDVTRSSNTVTDVVDGVTLELKGIGSASLDTTRDVDGTNESLNEFVERYNALRSTLSELGENELSGDRLTRNVGLRLQRAFNEPLELADGSTISPIELGFTFDRYGTLSIDAERMQAAQSEDMESFIDAFTREETGLGQRFSAILDEYSRAGGLITGREDGISSRRRGYDTQLDRFDYRLTKIEERYRQQFSTMDQLVSQLQNTSDSLYSRFSNFNN